MRYITVILPLKLEWEPYYEASGFDLNVGDRIRVVFASREYSAVVSDLDVVPVTDTSKINRILGKETGLEPIFPQEISLWRVVADYYMCSVGEVYKAAYPGSKISLEEARSRMLEKKQLSVQKKLQQLRQRLKKIEERLERIEAKEAKLLSKSGSSEKSLLKLMADKHSVLEKIQAEEDRLTALEQGCVNGFCSCESDCYDIGIVLSEAQEKAKNEICGAFSQGLPVLLEGVTGSGKTEIYLSLAADVLSAGKNVLYLVPEIALSRQLQERVTSVFGEAVRVFHSGETMASRRNTASEVRSSRGGMGYVVLGTRSSLFLPHNNLGLVIVDEEHDTSYKQDSPSPRYNGRDVAVMLATIHKCNILLGSATPSLESLYNCRYGKYRIVKLNKRYYDSVNADVELIDTIAERKKNGMIGSFSKKLIIRIQNTLSAGEQVIILRARKSFSPVMQCTECGYIPKCPHCNVSLSYHKSPERLLCHSCGHSQPFSDKCPECGRPLKGLGAGTQKIEEELYSLFPQARISRLDGDSAQNQTYEKDIIRKFSKKEIDILVGTQIVTKGFDFPDLTLVAVIQADSMLGVQDFRADERAFQVLEQFRGRCGRRGRKGLFVIQTAQPAHPVYQRLMEGASDIGETLLTERYEFGFPPFTRIVNVHLKDNNESRIERVSWSLSADLISVFGQEVVTSPYPPVVSKIADEHLRVIRLNLKKDKYLINNKKRLAEIVSAFQTKNKYHGHIYIDVDP